MESYYAQQSEMPHYSSYSRQRGSGFGALAAGIGRVVIPFTKRYVVPAAKRIGKELLMQTLPQLAEVITKRKSPRQAARDVVKQTIKKQVGGGRRRRGRRQTQRQTVRKTKRRPTRKKRDSRKVNFIRKSNVGQRSRASFFSNVNDAY